MDIALKRLINRLRDFIIKSYQEKINKLIVVTGKGIHSQNEKDPYVQKI